MTLRYAIITRLELICGLFHGIHNDRNWRVFYWFCCHIMSSSWWGAH